MSIEEGIIDTILYDLVDDVCSSIVSQKQKCLYKFVKVKNQKLMYVIFNYIYFILAALNLVQFKRKYQVNRVYCLVGKSPFIMKVSGVSICDNCVQLNKLQIPYEYIREIKNNNDTIQLNLIPNERNVNKILIDGKKHKAMYNSIRRNMNYHVRYHKLDNRAIKYYQKAHTRPIETYL